jgi:serine/threonine-protein kinase
MSVGSPMIGTVLHDRWRIVSELGRGGMGEVYLAEHVTLERKEALKILTPSAATDPQFVSRFRREARAVNRLRHPNIIALYDFGQLPDGRFYLSMEYAEGELLFDLLRRVELLAVPRALALLAQLAYAVHHAHSRGVVHRDLKPGNLIVADPGETLKVLDFGLAKIVAPDHAESMALSAGDVVWGTAKYMAPERVQGTGNDPRTDLYAIGCIAHELVVGAPPFTGSSNDVIHGHLSVEPEPPSKVRPSLGIPPELDAVILRCLAKRPDDRFQTAAELFAALHKIPEFPNPRPDARRASAPIERRPVMLSAHAAPDDPGGLRGVVRQLAEALLAAGVTDPRLPPGLAAITARTDVDRAHARLEQLVDELAPRVAGLEPLVKRLEAARARRSAG